MQTLQPVSKQYLTRLRKLYQAKGRKLAGCFVAEGPNAVRECLLAGLEPEKILVTDPDILIALDISREFRATGSLLSIEPHQLDQITNTKTPQGVLGVFKQPATHDWTCVDNKTGPVVILDEIQDPGNLGTCVRAAAALGGQAVLTTVGCADLWSPKGVRSAAAGMFRLPILTDLAPTEIRTNLSTRGWPIYQTTAGGISITSLRDSSSAFPALVFGNEGHGPKAPFNELPAVGLPLTRGVESLNVGAAVAACLALLGAK